MNDTCSMGEILKKYKVWLALKAEGIVFTYSYGSVPMRIKSQIWRHLRGKVSWQKVGMT